MIGRRLLFLTVIVGLAVGPVGSLAVLDCAWGAPAQIGKVGPELLALDERYREAQRTGFAFRAGDALVQIVDDRVIIDATAAGGDGRVLEADLVALGMRRAVMFGRVVSGEFPIAAIPALAALDSLAFVRAAMSVRREMPRLR